MALKIKEKAPDFTLQSTTGKDFSLSIDAYKKPILIYFYPKDFTRGCTLEACEFRDTFSFFKDLNIDIVGISPDNPETHLKFKQEYKLPFHLLSDLHGKVAEKYGASIPFIKFTRRISYLLDKDHIITAVYENLFSAKKHIQYMIEKVKTT